MPTFIHGIAASENIDSSGERISILGMDISSLDKDGVFNYEHKSDNPEQIVGKVLKARKILSEEDAEDDHQLYFWKKCGVPYLYVMGELFDDYKESAKEIAGMFRYDADHKEQNGRTVMNFSIEGAKIEKQGMDIVKSIARKVTLTPMPCNKAAVAEMVSIAPQKPKKASIDDLFKIEEVQAELFKGEIPASVKPKIAPVMKPIGMTRTNQPIHATARIADYKSFSSDDHSDAYDAHVSAANTAHKTGDFKTSTMHHNKAILHAGARNTLISRQQKLTANPLGSAQIGKPQASAQVPNIKKSLEAGSGLAAPSQLTGGAALAKESLNASRPNMGHGAIIHKPAPKPKGHGKVIMKSKWLARAEEEYQKWTKREHFESFMSKRMPHLTKGEIKAIGQVMALNKSMTLEEALHNLLKREDKIPGGLADKKKPSDFDSEKLAEGMKVESEHTSDPKIAEEIAMDHLTEDQDYYKKLKLVEKK